MDFQKNPKQTAAYLRVNKKNFDPISLGVSSFVLISVIIISIGVLEKQSFVDVRSLYVVIGGTLASVIFQYHLSTVLYATKLLFDTLFRTPEKKTLRLLRKLDEAIFYDKNIFELKYQDQLTGDLLNDAIAMHKSGLIFEEVESLLGSRIRDQYLQRTIAVRVFQTAAQMSPAFGLFGTVVGLVGVLKALTNPSQIGSAMALALMTTAYGAGLGTVILTPLAGRIEHHNQIFLEAHKQILNKLRILFYKRDRNTQDLLDPTGTSNGANL